MKGFIFLFDKIKSLAEQEGADIHKYESAPVHHELGMRDSKRERKEGIRGKHEGSNFSLLM